MASELKVTIEKVQYISEHPNADRLELAGVLGWQCIIVKDSLKVGDKVIYFPIDSVLPQKLEELIFSDSEVKLDKSRVRTIKLRGAIGQGLAIPLDVIINGGYAQYINHIGTGNNLTGILEVTKYVPKTPSPFSINKSKQTKIKNPNFHKYTDINNGKNYPNVFDNKFVVINEKIHGTNFRAGWVPICGKNIFNTLWKKLKSCITKYPGYEFVFGSHNVQLQAKKINKQLKDIIDIKPKKNVYEEICDMYNLRNKTKPNEVIYGEIFGEGIQKNYTYSRTGIDLVIFDLKKNGKYVAWSALKHFCTKNNLPRVPLLYIGRFSPELIDEYISGNSVLDRNQKHREGIVIKQALSEKKGYMGRMIFKYLNPDYLLRKGNSEWH